VFLVVAFQLWPGAWGRKHIIASHLETSDRCHCSQNTRILYRLVVNSNDSLLIYCPPKPEVLMCTHFKNWHV